MLKAHERHALRVRVRNAALRYGEALCYSPKPEQYHTDLLQLAGLKKNIDDAEMRLYEQEILLRGVCREELEARNERLAAARAAREEAKVVKRKLNQG